MKSLFFFGNVAKVIEAGANKNGFNTFFSSTENNDNTAANLVNKMKNSQVHRFIITATKGLKNEIIKIKKENIPFGLLDTLIPGGDANYVILDIYNVRFNYRST